MLRRAVAALGDELVELDVEGTRGWVTPAGAAAVAAAEPSRVVRLLPGFDPYVVGALRQLDRLLPAAGLRSAVSRTSGWISPVLLDGGRVAGTWTQDLTGGRLAVTVTRFGRLRPGIEEAAEAEAARWAAYADAPLNPHLGHPLAALIQLWTTAGHVRPAPPPGELGQGPDRPGPRRRAGGASGRTRV